MMPVADIRDIGGLTAKQALFVWAYLGPARLNASRAALMAKYSPRNPRQSGHQVLQNEKVREALRFLLPCVLFGAVKDYEKESVDGLHMDKD